MPDIAAAARDAYCAGWALSGGPMTRQVRAGCAASARLAVENTDEPRILEVALKLGSLTGTWAEVYRRREDLTASHVAAITVIWRKAVRKLKPRDLVARYRRMLIDAAEARAEGPGKWQADEARQSALGWLYQILSDPRYDDLARALSDALLAAAAEGRAAALAVAASQAAMAGFDWAKAYAAMYAGLADLEGLPGMGDPWVQRIIGAAATDVGRVLASMATAGASDSEIAAAVLDVIDGEDVQAASLLTDYAIGGAMGQASLNLYAAEGAQQIAWLDAADERVCPVCEKNAAQGPYSPGQFPELPAHVRCRCAPAPVDPLPLSAYADFLIPAA